MFEKRVVYYSLKFSLLQTVAVTIEDLVIYITEGLLHQRGIEFKPERFDGSFGYCWVTLWSGLMLPVWIDEPSTKGYSIVDRGPITQLLLDTWKQKS